MNSLVKFWIMVGAVVSAGGWILSATHQLNAPGYFLYFAIVAVVVWAIYRPSLANVRTWKQSCQKVYRRFRRPLPLAFLLLAVLALVGGMLYPPNNFDAMTYRTPRVLHWLAQEQWHWIHTPDPRMNTRACGFEWLCAPLLVFTRSDRLFFLINGISFLFLPGLIYSVFIRLGVRRRVAWHWMWVIPAGLNFVLQAGSIANDLFCVIYVLAAVGFALRARQSNQLSDLWYSVLAAGLLTGAKASNLPLLLPWFIAICPSLRLLTAAPVRSVMIGGIAILVSFLPSAILNARHCGDWSGAVLENSRFKVKEPLVGIAGNSLELAVENLALPVSSLPWFTEEKLTRLAPAKFLEAYNRNFASPFGSFWSGTGIQTEDGAGLGLGLCLLLIASFLATFFFTRRRRGMDWFGRILILSPYVALLVFMANAGMGQAARLISPYDPLLFPALLCFPANETIVRRSWWKSAALIVFLMAGAVLILSPARPLLPVQRLLRQMDQWKMKSSFLERARASYIANEHRSDGLEPLRALVPANVCVLGLVSQGNDVEASLWKPFGQRRVEYVLPTDTPEDLKNRGVLYVVASGETLRARHQTFDEWLTLNHAEKVGQQTFLRVFPPYIPYDWYVARIRF